MEYITSKVPAVSEKSEAGRIASYLRAHKKELNHALESLFATLCARLKKLEQAGLAEACFESGETDGWLWRRYSDGTAKKAVCISDTQNVSRHFKSFIKFFKSMNSSNFF